MNNRQDSPTHLDPCTRLRLTQSAKMLLKFAVEIDRFNFKAQTFLKRDKPLVHQDHEAEKPETEQDDKPNRDDCADTEATRQMEFERRYRWNTLIKEAQHTRRLIRKSITTAKAVVRELKEAKIDSTSPRWQENFKAFRNSKWIEGAMFAALTKRGVNADLLKAAMQLMLKEDKSPDIELLLKDLVTLSDNFSTRINKQMLNAGTDDEQDDAITSTSVSGLSVTISVPCELLPPPLNAGCLGLVILGIGLGALIIGVGAFIEDVFNGTDDDNARDTINGNPCNQLNAMSLQAKLDLINPILEGHTGDDDENAILRILDCASCAEVNQIVNAVGLTNLLDEFHGEEWDRLVIRLRECGRLSFADWDDDATRLFINTADCATLNALNLNDVRQLMLNMFSGSAGDDDENAILRVISCLPCSQIRVLMSMPDMSYDDFDDVVDGEEWDRLERRLRGCGIRD